MDTIVTVGGIGDILHGLLGIQLLYEYEISPSIKWDIYTHADDSDTQITYFINDYIQNMYTRKNSKTIITFNIHKHNEYDPTRKYNLGHANIYMSYDEKLRYMPIKHSRIKDYNLTYFPKEPNPFIGIMHPFGSKFSNNFLKQTQNKTKEINKDLLTNIFYKTVQNILPSSRFYSGSIIGSEKELQDYKSIPSLYLYATYCLFKDLISTFNLIDMCDFVIAADSSIKTYSLIQGVPTLLVLNGSYKDEFRDKHFIHPYINKPYFYLHIDNGDHKFDIENNAKFDNFCKYIIDYKNKRYIGINN